MSSEEVFIQSFLDKNNIKNEFEKEQIKLKGDTKEYRKPDFYLPEYNIYLEYYGLYNQSKVHRSEYDFKTELYIKNSIGTIIIKPHELGIIEYAFHSKMLALLKYAKFNKDNQLMKYKRKRFQTNMDKTHLLRIWIMLILVGILLYVETGLNPIFQILVAIVLYLGIIGNIVFIGYEYYKYVYKDK